MISWFLFLICAACLFMLLYPYAVYPVILSLIPKKHVVVPSPHNIDSFKVALVFCAYNEEESLPDTITNIQKLKEVMPSLEVYAYSDASTDATNDLLLNAADLLHPVIGKERLGKIKGMRKLVSMTDADIVVFIDANVILEPKTLPLLIGYFNDPEIGCVSGRLMYKEIDSTTAEVGGLYWKLEEMLKYLETRTGSMMGADGAIFARRRNGYPDIPANMVDDMAVSMAVILEGKRCISAPDVIAYENAISSSTEEFSRKKRIACGSYSTYLYQKKALKQMSFLNQFKFISHKLIRWWGAFFIVIGLFSLIMWGFSLGIGLPLLIATLLVTGVFIFLGRANIPIISPIYEILSAIFATGLGVIEALTGKRYKTWNTANSR